MHIEINASSQPHFCHVAHLTDLQRAVGIEQVSYRLLPIYFCIWTKCNNKSPRGPFARKSVGCARIRPQAVKYNVLDDSKIETSMNITIEKIAKESSAGKASFRFYYADNNGAQERVLVPPLDKEDEIGAKLIEAAMKLLSQF